MEVSDKLVAEVLAIPEETQTIEFKRLDGERVVAKIIQTMVAMANTDGGRIVVGVDDPEKSLQSGIDRVYGIEENIELFDSIKHELRRIVPPISGMLRPKMVHVKEVNKTIAIFEVSKATESFHSIEDIVYIRLNKSNKRLTAHEIVKMSYAKGFEKADRELVKVDFELLRTTYYEDWRASRGITDTSIRDVLYKTGLARRENGTLFPTRAAVLLFAQYPTNLMDTKCTIRILQYTGTVETYGETPNLIGNPITIEGPLIKLIADAQAQVLQLLRSGIEIRSGFVTRYRIPERALKEAITNAVIHRDYHIKRDIEVKIFEDRVEINNPGLLPYNITTRNIGKVRADGYRNDIIVKHLREFPAPPNLDQNEGVRAIQSEMISSNLYPAAYWTYPMYEDAVEVGLFNEIRATEWDKVREYLIASKYIDNKTARQVTGVVQVHNMSRLFTKWINAGLLIKIQPKSGSTKFVKYKLANADDLEHA
jgi:ATP-dependent DNA helicase RecG